jgi:hypothetical protein
MALVPWLCGGSMSARSRVCCASSRRFHFRHDANVGRVVLTGRCDKRKMRKETVSTMQDRVED